MKHISKLWMINILLLFIVFTWIKHVSIYFYPQCIQDDVSSECLDRYLNVPLDMQYRNVVNYLREFHLHPTTGSQVPVPLKTWQNLLDWKHIQETIKEMFSDKPPGVFVEIGATDGVFMSNTLFLEQNLRWTGLLIEPDPRTFPSLLRKRSGSIAADVCIDSSILSSNNLWQRKIPANYPEYIQEVMRARSFLWSDVDMDINEGRKIQVVCTTLDPLLTAANITIIDLLVVNTGTLSPEYFISDALESPKFDIKMLLVTYPPNDQVDGFDIEGFTLLKEKSGTFVKFYRK